MIAASSMQLPTSLQGAGVFCFLLLRSCTCYVDDVHGWGRLGCKRDVQGWCGVGCERSCACHVDEGSFTCYVDHVRSGCSRVGWGWMLIFMYRYC